MLKLLARNYSAAAVGSQKKKISIIGAGLMGSGIAQVAAMNGYAVTLVDLSEKSLAKGKQSIEKSLTKLSAKQPALNVKDILGSIEFTGEVAKAKNSFLVVEAVVENVKVKRELFQQLKTIAPSALLCSNTSSIPIKEIGSGIYGLHFFNPVPSMKLVEVISDSGDRLNELVQFVKSIGKVPVVCKDTPGFIVNRLLVPYLLESIRLLERGDAKMEDIDTAMKLGAGYPMGPFELADFVGLDTLKFICDGWYSQSQHLKGNDLVKTPKLLNEMVNQGKLGRKSGAGFYDYSQKK